MSRTRGARGGLKLNRTLGENPATASLHSATPKRKSSLFFDFLENGKDIFLFGILPSKYSGSVAGFQYGLGEAEKQFFWGKGFLALPRLISRPQEVWGGMRAGFDLFEAIRVFRIDRKTTVC